MWVQLWWLWSRLAPRSRRPSWLASWSRPPRSCPGEEFVRLGRLPGVGFRGSRPGKVAQCLECLEARRPDNFFRRTRGSRLGYPWPFTPTVVPEADWASRLGRISEARSASYLDKPAAGSRPWSGAPPESKSSGVGGREPAGARSGPRAGHWPSANHVAGKPASPRARRDVAAGRGPATSVPRPRRGSFVSRNRPHVPCGSFGSHLCVINAGRGESGRS